MIHQIGNRIRSALSGPAGVVICHALFRACKAGSLSFKFLPDNRLLKGLPPKRVFRNGFEYELDLCDYIDWYLFFKSKTPYEKNYIVW